MNFVKIYGVVGKVVSATVAGLVECCQVQAIQIVWLQVFDTVCRGFCKCLSNRGIQMGFSFLAQAVVNAVRVHPGLSG